jgi:hypothetical protein
MDLETGGSMPHPQGLSNNPDPEPNLAFINVYLRSIIILSIHLHLILPKGLFPVV